MEGVPLAVPDASRWRDDIPPRERMVDLHFRVPAVTFRELQRLAQDYDSFGSLMRHIIHSWLRSREP